MNCPICNIRMNCYCTRKTPNSYRYRYYKCMKCNHRITTVEYYISEYDKGLEIMNLRKESNHYDL